ncbi:gamma-glutamyltransferase [Acidobacteriota bacterium]
MKIQKSICFGFLILTVLLFGSCRKVDDHTLVVAHRGASSLAPENTLASVNKALELGADQCEIDVQLTKDGEVVLLHDSLLKRTAGREGVLSDYTLDELRELEVGNWFSQDFRGEPIPTLREVIRAVKGKMLLNIEIKVSRTETDIVNKVVEIIQSERIRKKCIVTSFGRNEVEKVKELDPRIMTGFIFSQKYPPDVFEGNWEALSCNYRVVDADFVAKAREAEKKIYVWTVDDREEMKRLIALQVDGIITNRPQDMISLVAVEAKNLLPGTGLSGMVSSAHPIATQAGLDILKAGGNAFDAAVAIASTLNVVEPAMSGIGGYGTILVYVAKEKRVRFLDSSGKIPNACDSDLFRAPAPNYLENRRGAKAVSTPGNVNAWESMSKNYGKLAWPKLFEPAIRAAEEGFELGERGAAIIGRAFDSFPAYAQEFYGKNGFPLGEGEMLIQLDLAESLKKIAEEGASSVYGGAIGVAINEEMQKSGGFLSAEDLVADKAEWWEPIHIEYRGFQVYTASPPSTAFPSLIRLGLMSRYDNLSLGFNSEEYLHRFAEVSKHAFWCRLAYAGDPEINPPPLDRLLNEAYWEKEAAEIDLDTAKPFSPPEVSFKQGDNTTHFVVADRWGNIVSATQTLGNAFGSRIMPEGTGVWLNNSLYYCTFEPKGNPMDAHPGHRKLSGDCPTIIFMEGKPWVALGTPGGHTIGQTIPQMVMNLIDFRMDIQQALAAPRVSFVEPDFLFIESGVPESVREALSLRGHNIRISGGLGNAHALVIMYDTKGRPKSFEGAADPRGEGKAEGY